LELTDVSIRWVLAFRFFSRRIVSAAPSRQPLPVAVAVVDIIRRHGSTQASQSRQNGISQTIL
jgi:hypothetical protein